MLSRHGRRILTARNHIRYLATNPNSSTPNYASTLQLPTTKFGPKIPKSHERDQLIATTSSELYQWQRDREVIDKAPFILHDGPPYANGDLHLGHALNKILKDIINRFELIYNNSKIQYVPGWDCHGLPIEMKATNLENEIKKQTISKNKRKKAQTMVEASTKEPAAPLSAVEIRNACRKLATEMIENQKVQFNQFAIMADFHHPYITMNHQYEINQLKIFQKLMENGLLSRQLKPVWWGCETETALAEAELEYNNSHKSTAIYVKFPLISEDNQSLLERLNLSGSKQLHLLIWTSTPWTIPANKAVCINKDLTYSLISKGDDYLIVAQPLAEQILSLNEEYMLVDEELTFTGSELIGYRYSNPASADNSLHPILHGDHVISTAGTGLVHTAPAHGGDDYLIGKKNRLNINSSVNGKGRYIKDHLPTGFHSLINEKVTEPSTIFKCIEILTDNDMIFNVDKNFIHSYPYDWRSKTPVIQRSTPQWFVNVEKIKSVAIEALEKVGFYPESGKNRLPSFIKNRNEWCISRQRTWGVPLPIIYNRENDQPLDDIEIVEHIINKISELGTDEWFVVEDDISRWLPPHLKPNSHLYKKGQDTMDVWFDSGTSWTTIDTGKGVEQSFISDKPLANVYLEGSDQHRGWFQSSLLNKIIASGTNGADFRPIAPFQKIITHGFTLDSKNEKMSKSKGNVISPQHVIDGGGKPLLPSLGTDGLRLWVASSNYNVDVNVGPEILTRVFENVKKLRVTFKYLLGNVNDFNTPVAYNELNPLDKYSLSKLYKLQQSCVENYTQYNFSRVVNEINFHMNTILSSLYFDISKDCLYTDAIDSVRRRSIQTVLQQILKTYIGLLAPIQPILTQEVWKEYQTLFNVTHTSPFMMGDWSEFYQLPQQYLKESIESEFDDNIWKLRDHIYKQMEQLRLSGVYKNKLELEVNLSIDQHLNPTIYQLFTDHLQFLDDYLLVSKVTINDATNAQHQPYHVSQLQLEEHSNQPEVSIAISISNHAKCPRCWKFIAPSEHELCHKCNSVVHP